MKALLRLLIVLLRASTLPRRAHGDVSRIAMRVAPGDLDLFGHMNNGTFLTLQDLGRVDYMVRTGLLRELRAHGWNPVVVAQTISYRASLHLGERFLIETRYLGADDYGVYMEQRFTVDGQLRSQSFVRARFVSKGGSVPMADVLAAAPEVTQVPNRIPDWVHGWAEHTRMPSRRADASSVWDGSAVRPTDVDAAGDASSAGDVADATAPAPAATPTPTRA